MVAVLATPLASFVCSRAYVARLPRANAVRVPASAVFKQGRKLLSLGMAFVATAALMIGSQLVMRALVQRDLGADSLGCYTAAWTISVTYVGLILAAMATDYYPRLAAIIQDHQAVNVLVNQQTEVALAISGPIFLAVLALMPWIVEILFSAKFAAAVEVLRWQVLGDVLKITSWPLGFIMLAAAAGRTLIVSDAIAILIFVVLTGGASSPPRLGGRGHLVFS